MTEFVAVRTAPVASARDFVELGKPRLSTLVIFTSAIGLWLSPVRPDWIHGLVFLLATSCLVAAANALNCWIEREIDGRMRRTGNRPLPAGRMEPGPALAFGVTLAIGSLLALLWSSNVLTAGLGLSALVLYAAVYTPLKRITPWSVVVGAVPGAIPPLMGWTAAYGKLATPGWFLFGILFFWQLPHFIAISINLLEDFRAAGFRTLPLVRGVAAARRHLLVYTILLVALSLLALPLGIAGWLYTTAAALLGAGFIGLAAMGVRKQVDPGWARRLFLFTLIYLPLLIGVLVVDAA